MSGTAEPTPRGVGVYVALVRSRGVARLAVAFLLLGTANTMTPVAFVLFARSLTRSFAQASLVLAASTAGGLMLGPLRGRLVDRLGPRRAVLALALPDAATDVAFVAAGRAHVGVGALVALALCAGAVTAPAAPALRSAWSDALAGGASRHAGYALMTVLQETTFIAGPLMAGGLIALFSTTVAVLASALISLAGALAFALPHAPGAPRETPTASTPSARRRLPALEGSGIRTVVATSACFGLTFGILDVAFPAYARRYGAVAEAGVLLSAFAAGSWVGGLLYGLRASGGRAGARYPRACLLATAGLVPLISALGFPAMLLLSAVSGLCFAPMTTTQIAVIDEVAPPAHRSEAFSWLATLYGSGLAAGAALAGGIVSLWGVRATLAAAAAATALAWLLSTTRARTLR